MHLSVSSPKVLIRSITAVSITWGMLRQLRTLAVIVDIAPPETSIGFNHQSYLAGEEIIISRDTEVTLTAVDDLSGVQATFYRFDDEQDWIMYDGLFRLADLDYGARTIHFHSVDHVGNSEAGKIDYDRSDWCRG